MINAIREAYVGAWKFARALPWIVAIIAAAEFAQHIAEIRLGIYDSFERAKALQNAPLRMITGHIKVLVLAILGYSVARYLAFGNDRAAATRIDRRAVRLFVWVLAFDALWLIIALDVPPLLGDAGFDPDIVRRLVIAASIASFLVQLVLAPWKIAAALGNPAIGFARSIRLSLRHILWALVFVMLAELPLLALHYGLFLGAIGRASIIVWPMALFDAIVVAYVGVLIVAASFVLARRTTAAAGVSLLPADRVDR
jgi:hypothetical protein